MNTHHELQRHVRRAADGCIQSPVMQVQWQLNIEEDSVTKVCTHLIFKESLPCLLTMLSKKVIQIDQHLQWWGAELLNQPSKEDMALWRIRCRTPLKLHGRSAQGLAENFLA